MTEQGQHYRRLGGYAFLSGNYDDAASLYGRAVELGGSPEVSYLFSDSLLHLGHYRRAAATPLSDAVSGSSLASSIRIHAIVRRVVFETTGLQVQQRERIPDERYELIDTQREQADFMLDLRNWDALEPKVWFNLAFHADSDYEAFERFVVSAVLQQDYAAGWAVALYSAVRAEVDQKVLMDLCNEAFKKVSASEILRAISEHFVHDEVTSDALYSAIATFSDRPSSKPASFIEVGLIDGTWFRFNMESEDGRAAFEVLRLVGISGKEERSQLLRQIDTSRNPDEG